MHRRAPATGLPAGRGESECSAPGTEREWSMRAASSEDGGANKGVSKHGAQPISAPRRTCDQIAR